VFSTKRVNKRFGLSRASALLHFLSGGEFPNRREYAKYEPEADVSDSIRKTEQGKSQTARQ
jgi:hypothetical protein